MSQRERAAAQTAVSKRERVVLGVLGGQEGLQQLSFAGKVFERDRQDLLESMMPGIAKEGWGHRGIESLRPHALGGVDELL